MGADNNTSTSTVKTIEDKVTKETVSGSGIKVEKKMPAVVKNEEEEIPVIKVERVTKSTMATTKEKE